MAFWHFRFSLLVLVATSWLAAMPGVAQIVPDATVNSIVTPNGNSLQINGGTTAGGNLFHSFQDFSVPTGTEAFFNNPLSVENIITRVTGSNISHIDGLIRANGHANLFLLNPKGIIFGPNARLNTGGSFIGSTAERINFADGVDFSATNPPTNPLLTVSVPIGLQLSSSPGAIVVRGTGHTAQYNFFTSVSGLNLDSYNLQVKPGKTLALVGGNLSLEGGLLSASGGHIELGSITNGSVILNAHPQGLTLTYPATNSFGNIQMIQKAITDVSGVAAGSVQIQGQQVNIESGSMVLVQNQGNQSAGNITVNATESLHISGIASNLSNPSSVISETRSTGAAGNITLTSPLIQINNGGVVRNRTFSNGLGGNIILNATNQLDVSGQTGIGLFAGSSQIFATTHADGSGGNVSITSRNFSITNGGQVGARTYNSGLGGDLMVQADSILILSPTPPPGGIYGVTTSPSLLSVSTFGSGNTGNLTIHTRTLSVQNGGILSASTLERGNAGTLMINASEWVEVKDGVSDQDTSYIAAAGLSFRGFGGLDLRGDAGQVTINTPILKVSNGARIFVRNQGPGNAGILRINADKIQLDTGGNISASTKEGEGGNIDLQIADLLQMRRGSFINAEAGGIGNGGNINLNAPVVVGLENSDIIANAVQGRGGNIQISTQGIFGLEFRPQSTAQSDITASSQFGVSGTVSISTVDVQPDATLVELPQNLVDPSQQIAQGCASSNENRFVATGRGGVPPNPTQRLEEEQPWADVRDLSAFRRSGNRTASLPQATQPPLVEANTWRRNATGQVEIYVAQTGNTSPHFSRATCSVSPVSHR